MIRAIRAIRVVVSGIFVGFKAYSRCFFLLEHTGYFVWKGIGYKSILLKQNLT